MSTHNEDRIVKAAVQAQLDSDVRVPRHNRVLRDLVYIASLALAQNGLYAARLRVATWN